MLQFELWSDDSREKQNVYIDPSEVASVVESEDRRAFGGWQQVAIIHLVTGQTHKVYDGSRSAARKILEAKS